MNDTPADDFGLPDDPTEPAPITRPVKPARKERAEPHGLQLPYTEEGEQQVLGSILVDGAVTITRCRDRGIYADSFHLPANRVIFNRLTKLNTEGKPLTIDVLAEELLADGLIESVGGLAYLLSISSKVPTTAQTGYFIDKVWEVSAKRDIFRKSEEIKEHAANGSDVSEIVAELEALTKRLTEGSTSSSRKATLEKLAARRVRKISPPPEPVTRLFLAGKPIATPGNIQTLIARAKQGKTATTGGAAAAIIAAHYDRQGLDCLGFTAPHTKEAVVLIDTEQSPYDAWTCLDRILARAQQPVDPEWLCHYAFVGMSVAQKKEAFILALEEAKKAHGGIFMVILDGVAHFVSSVNDEVECNEVSIWIRALSITYNCPIMCIIHSNEGIKSGDDGRGHLGKQLTRDAESNLLLKKVGEITTITSEKQRKAPITEADNVAFKWDDIAGRHVSCGQVPKAQREGRPSVYHFEAISHIFPKATQTPSTYRILAGQAKEVCGISEPSFRRLLSDSVKTGLVIRCTPQDGGSFAYHLPPV